MYVCMYVCMCVCVCMYCDAPVRRYDGLSGARSEIDAFISCALRHVHKAVSARIWMCIQVRG